jgi:hypothetical protein
MVLGRVLAMHTDPILLKTELDEVEQQIGVKRAELNELLQLRADKLAIYNKLLGRRKASIENLDPGPQ